MSAATTKAATILALSLDAIVESADNPRKHFDPSFIAELAGSLKTSGQFTPCLVRPHPKLAGKFELAAGATRLRAARAAKLERLDCIVRPLDDGQFLELLTFENLKRRDLQPMEEARGYALLQKRLEGWTTEKLAERSGVSPDYVRDRLRLLKLAPKAVELLEDHQIPLTHALELAKIGEKDQLRVIEDGLFEGETGQYSVDKELSKQLGQDELGDKPVSLAELRRFIDDNVRVDIEHPELQFLMPETHKAVADAKAAKRRIIFIALGSIRPEIRGNEKIVSSGSWRRADGDAKSKTCEYSVLGVVHGSDAARGRAFLVCTRKDKCAIHWPQRVKRALERAKAKRGELTTKSGVKVSEAAIVQKQSASEAKEQAARAARELALEKARPEVLAALVAAVRKAKPASLIDALYAALENVFYLGHDEKKTLAMMPKGKTMEDAVRRLYWLTLLDENDGPLCEYNDHQLAKFCKERGVDLGAIIAKHMPAPKVEKPVVEKPAKKAFKKKPNAAFMQPVQPNDRLALIVGAKPLPQTELTKKLWEYIKRNNLQDKKNRRMINADDALLPIFGGKKQVSMFDMTKLVKKQLR